VRVMALDPGDRRIGIALSDLTGTLARPLQSLVRRSRAEDLGIIRSLIEQNDVELLVIGMPLSLSGERGPQARKVIRYAAMLGEALPVPVVTWDERYSSAAAREILQRNRGRGKERSWRKQGIVDAVAAAVILQGYLDSQDRELRQGTSL